MKIISTQKHNILIVLLVMAFFTGATIQFGEGSIPIGILMFLITLGLTTRFKLQGAYITKSSKFYIVLGIFILFADILYNLKAMNQLGTLDTMALFMGISFIAYGTGKYRRIGEFGIYMSGTFILLFLLFYIILPSLKNNFIHDFDHYFVLLPSLFIATSLTNMDLHIVGIETVHFNGFEDATVVIGGPCSGLYSMMLLLGIIVGYVKMENITENKNIYLLMFAAIVIAYFSNLIRVSILYIVGYYYGIEKMMFVHVYIGWFIFIIISFGMMMALNRIK
ncbi:MAG: archaeosortase C [Candidatus Methanoperedens sp.]|uniref:archaeosortase C n=1 Tax=Candidatus Methanoperedens sp. BLZ2 TaxID=2035255 RepID=UPI0011428C88|nr:archaeosortase C [Candidatus Methanoperedens sp. BLZ2]KAB2946146.1 MAG: archaeosortase C [Candidatus Methanoperedens sp.]MBZ0177221.1 archaeosortase C [Candidatus Methanoperedens nitroreducens]MCX9077905.1 archaeosortase C [Candidatus Methanoperedens sp.]